MKRLFMTLYADLTDQAPQGAGWYISVTGDEGMYVQPTLVSERAVPSVVLDFERLIRDIDTIPDNEVTLGGLMTQINDQIRTALKEQLEYAERVAAQVPALRARLDAQLAGPGSVHPLPNIPRSAADNESATQQ